jgi:hypothetical protein
LFGFPFLVSFFHVGPTLKKYWAEPRFLVVNQSSLLKVQKS